MMPIETVLINAIEAIDWSDAPSDKAANWIKDCLYDAGYVIIPKNAARRAPTAAAPADSAASP